MELLQEIWSIIMHLDMHLNNMTAAMGPWVYVLLFLIVFCETGLIVMPFLPGDSLLFALGALTATEDAFLSLPVLMILLISAGVLGDAVNYTIGKYFGQKIFSSTHSRFFHRDHLVRTSQFYEKHGGKTIILARYMPIIRTFAPFVAGMGQMNYRRFAIYNIVGAVSWVLVFLLAGHFFGNIPSVKTNFHIVIFGIIGISVMPMAIELVRSRVIREKASFNKAS